jgi:hypothetical protein
VIVGIVLLLTSFASWLGWVLLVIGGYFGIVGLQHRNSSRLYVQAASGALVRPDEGEMGDESDVERRELNFGADLGTIFIYDFVGRHRDNSCYEHIANSILSNKVEFLLKFHEVLAAAEKKYPEWKEVIRSISIKRIDVYGRKSGCVAVVIFNGDQGEFWRVEYDGKNFTDLILDN